MNKEMELPGSVEKVRFVNPHGSLTIGVKNADGSSTSWVLTLGSATALAQRGIPARDGSPIGFLKSVKFPDGHVIQISAGNPND